MTHIAYRGFTPATAVAAAAAAAAAAKHDILHVTTSAYLSP